MPIVFQRLVRRVGFGWAVRAIALILLVLLAVAIILMKPRVKPTTLRRIWSSALLRHGPFITFSIGGFITLLSLYVPFYYIQLYARENLGITPDLSFYTLAIVNSGSVIGRIASAYLAMPIGPVSSTVICTAITAILCFSWIGVYDLGGLVTFALFYGIFSGSLLTLFSVSTVALSTDMSTVGTRVGMSFGIMSIALLPGEPIAGAILGNDGDMWQNLQIYTGVVTVSATMMFSFSFLLLTRERKTYKV